MSSPTIRSKAEIARRGGTCGVVEKWVTVPTHPAGGVRIDFLGCIDLLAVFPPAQGILGVQACAGSSHAARRTKALEEPRLAAWLEAGGRFEVWSWAKRGARGKRKLWTLRAEPITLEDIARHVPVLRPLSDSICPLDVDELV